MFFFADSLIFNDMDLWILLSLLGGVLQAFRVAGQRLLAKSVPLSRVAPSDAASPFARVVLGIPVVAGILLLVSQSEGASLTPLIKGGHLGPFWLWILLVAMSQIAATVLQTRLVSRRNFALGVMYVKVLIPAAAIFGVVFFGDSFGLLEWAAIAMGTLGLILLSYGKVAGKPDLQWDWMTVWFGLGAGFLLAITGLAAREASAVLPQNLMGPITRGVAALLCTVVVQFIVCTLYIAVRDPREFLDLFDRWWIVLNTSLFSISSSLCWFIAFTLAHPALVNLVGQSEFFFALGISIIFFRDWPTRGEIIGMAIMALAILALLWH